MGTLTSSDNLQQCLSAVVGKYFGGKVIPYGMMRQESILTADFVSSWHG